jgi:glycosyltransferase involved in cell wall biosynthesis
VESGRDDTLISVVVPTRNRPDHLAECLASILRCADEHFEVTVVDQSDDDRTRLAVAEVGDPRVRHIATDTRGAARARNLGIAESRGAIVAFTDDDCRVDEHWLGAFRSILHDASVGMVLGSVAKGESDDPAAEAAEFLPKGTFVYRSLPPVSEPWGISASMAARRGILDRLHGFDQRLGPGAPINMGGEDSDLLIRVLSTGHAVAATDRTVVTHLGFRSGDEATDLYRGYAYALGAVFMKHLRLRTRPGYGQLPRWLLHFTRQAVWNSMRRQRPTGAGFALGLVRGAVATARLPIDRTTRQFS